jgi:hypothetical protein
VLRRLSEVPWLGALLQAGIAIGALASLVAVSAASAASSDCASGQPAPVPPRSTPVSPPVALTPADDSKLLSWKFGTRRNETSWDVTIDAAPGLAGVDPAEIGIRAARLTRSDSSERLAKPTFTAPVITPNHKHITFTVCENARGGAPGSYTGSLIVEGPDGVADASVPLAVTLKATGGTFGLIEIIVLVTAILAMTLKGVADYKKSKFEGDNVPTPAPSWSWKDALTYNWSNPSGVVTSAIALLLAVGGAYLLYHKTETWGADLTPDLLAVLQSALVAVGVQGGLSGLGSAFKQGD